MPGLADRTVGLNGPEPRGDGHSAQSFGRGDPCRPLLCGSIWLWDCGNVGGKICRVIASLLGRKTNAPTKFI